jgi:hypothetical protein
MMEPMDAVVDELVDEPKFPAYYTGLRSEQILEAIRDFDDPANLEYFNDGVTSSRTRNFFVDFGDGEAWSAFDLEAIHYSRLIKSPVSPTPACVDVDKSTLVNIWPETRKPKYQVDVRRVPNRQAIECSANQC